MKTIFGPLQQRRLRVCGLLVACTMMAVCSARSRPRAASQPRSSSPECRHSEVRCIRWRWPRMTPAGCPPMPAQRHQHLLQPFRRAGGRSCRRCSPPSRSRFAPVSPVAHARSVCRPLRHGAVRHRRGAELASAAGIFDRLRRPQPKHDPLLRHRGPGGIRPSHPDALLHVGRAKHFAPSTRSRSRRPLRRSCRHSQPERFPAPAAAHPPARGVYLRPVEQCLLCARRYRHDIRHRPVYSAGINGTGQSIAIAGQSAIAGQRH